MIIRDNRMNGLFVIPIMKINAIFSIIWKIGYKSLDSQMSHISEIYKTFDHSIDHRCTFSTANVTLSYFLDHYCTLSCFYVCNLLGYRLRLTRIPRKLAPIPVGNTALRLGRGVGHVHWKVVHNSGCKCHPIGG